LKSGRVVIQYRERVREKERDAREGMIESLGLEEGWGGGEDEEKVGLLRCGESEQAVWCRRQCVGGWWLWLWG
jgi:hypothetical protein